MSIRRSIIVCALFILALSASPALASQSVSAARAQARYYASYGEPTPLEVPQSDSASSGDTWLPVLLIGSVAIACAGLGVVQIRRIRHRPTAGAAS